MKKKISISFFKKLIDSDFLILDTYSAIENRYFKESLSKVIKKKNSFILLEPFETLKSIKQLIRILQFFKRQANPLLHIEVENKQFLDILDTFIIKKPNILPIKLKKSVSDKRIQKENSNFILFLNQIISNKMNTKLLKNLFYENIFIVNKINSKLEEKNSYKIFNDFNTFKKLIFLLVLINQIYNKN